MKNQELMFAKVEQWQNTKMTKQAFAAANGLSYDSFTRWCRRYNEVNSPAQKPAPEFIEILSTPKSERKAMPASERIAKIAIELPGGIHIKIY